MVGAALQRVVVSHIFLSPWWPPPSFLLRHNGSQGTTLSLGFSVPQNRSKTAIVLAKGIYKFVIPFPSMHPYSWIASEHLQEHYRPLS